jgi:hypothetical protein
LEINNTKDNVEIVHWHYIRSSALDTLKRQAKREGGHILILPSEEEAGGLSSRTSNLSSSANVQQNSVTAKGNDEKVSKDNPLSLLQVRRAQKWCDVKDIKYERERTERDIQGFGGAGLGTAAVRYASAVL